MSVSQLQSQLDWSKKQTSYAWAKYYGECNSEHEQNINTFNIMSQSTLDEATMPAHFIKEYEEFLIKLKEKIDCPICLEVIVPGTLEITKCGHKYCKTCLKSVKETSKKCAICRRKLCR